MTLLLSQISSVMKTFVDGTTTPSFKLLHKVLKMFLMQSLILIPQIKMLLIHSRSNRSA